MGIESVWDTLPQILIEKVLPYVSFSLALLLITGNEVLTRFS